MLIQRAPVLKFQVVASLATYREISAEAYLRGLLAPQDGLCSQLGFKNAPSHFDRGLVLYRRAGNRIIRPSVVANQQFMLPRMRLSVA